MIQRQKPHFETAVWGVGLASALTPAPPACLSPKTLSQPLNGEKKPLHRLPSRSDESNSADLRVFVNTNVQESVTITDGEIDVDLTPQRRDRSITEGIPDACIHLHPHIFQL